MEIFAYKTDKFDTYTSRCWQKVEETIIKSPAIRVVVVRVNEKFEKSDCRFSFEFLRRTPCKQTGTGIVFSLVPKSYCKTHSVFVYKRITQKKSCTFNVSNSTFDCATDYIDFRTYTQLYSKDRVVGQSVSMNREDVLILKIPHSPAVIV